MPAAARRLVLVDAEPAGAAVPHARFLAGGCDDYVLRLSLPGGVVQDCTVEQAQAFEAELHAAVELAARVQVRDRRVRR